MATCLIQSSKVDYANYFKIPFPERKYDCGFMQKGDYTFVYFFNISSREIPTLCAYKITKVSVCFGMKIDIYTVIRFV